MRLDPSLTFRGALDILGEHQRPVLETVDRLLGGVILAGSAVTGTTAMLGLIDPKTEARGLIRGLLDAGCDRLFGTSGYERHQLISAAHTVIVVSAFFDSLRAGVGPAKYARLAMSRHEQVALAGGSARRADGHLLDRILNAPVPMPYGHRGFRENLTPLRGCYEDLADSTLGFLNGLQAWHEIQPGDPIDVFVRRLTDESLRRYETDYQKLMVAAPEFGVWATLGEHGATRAQVETSTAKLLAAVRAQDQTLRQLRELLAATGSAHQPDLRSVLADLNRAVLNQPVIQAGALDHIRHVVFPRLSQCYVAPNYQLALADERAQPAREEWWAGRPIRDDLFGFLTAHLCSPESTRLPMLVLGHPGAGKSLLMKFVAAWLPEETFTVVRVPLRRVDGNAPVYRQIQQALAAETHDRVSWQELTTQSRSAIRVVLLDGLDELIQATNVPQSSYLDAVAEFQRREAELGAPVAVIVTTRTVVADRAHIPPDSLLVKLADFDEEQIARWLEVWRQANEDGERRGTFRGLTLDSALRHAELAAHPLLLFMLALYTADPTVPDPGDEVLSTAALYQRLLDNFIRRELAKSTEFGAIDESAIDDRLWYLGIAAFGMFNRGRQHVAGPELDRDFDALMPDLPGESVSAFEAPPSSFERPLSRSQRLVGQFFFIHAAEARDLGSQRSSYEFLHATFGEYLIAATILELLADITRQRRAARRDNLDEASVLVRKLLSHQPLLKRRSILTFAEQLHAPATARDSARLMDTLNQLIARATHLPPAPVDRYRPSTADAVQQLAAYHANLVALRVFLTGVFDLGELTGTDESAQRWRARALRLWRAGLDDEGWQVMVQALSTTDGNKLVVRKLTGVPSYSWLAYSDELYGELAEAQLLTDLARSARLGLGDLALQRLGLTPRADALLALTLTPHEWDAMDQPHLIEMFSVVQRASSLAQVESALLAGALARFADRLPYSLVSSLVELLLRGVPMSSPTVSPGLARDLARITAAWPQLLSQHHALRHAIGAQLRHVLLLTGASLLNSDADLGHETGLLDYVTYAANRWLSADQLLDTTVPDSTPDP